MEHREDIPARRTSLALARELTPARTMQLVVFLLVFSLGARLRIDTDVWWHIRAGGEILDNGIIRNDSWSFTKAGADWIDHSWGAQVVFDLVWRAGGYGGLVVLTGLLGLAGTWLVFRMCSGDVYTRALGAAFGALTASIFWSPRPHMFSYALTALVLYLLFLRRHRGVDRLWAIPPLMLVWANLHGAFAIGFVLLAAVIVGEALEQLLPLDDRSGLGWRGVRKLALVFLASVAAVCVNPYGPRILAVPFETAGSSYARIIEEWQPPDLHEPSFWPFALMLVALLLAIGASPRRLGWTDGVLLSVMTLFALSAGRNVATFAVVVTPVLTYHFAAVLEARGRSLRTLQRATPALAALNVAIVVAVAAIVAVRTAEPFRDATLAAAERAELPVVAVEYLRTHPVEGHLFNQYGWGGYLIHALPDVPVFVDGRSDLYGGDFLVDPYLVTASGGPGWKQRLDGYGIGTVLVPREGGLAGVLRDDPDWRVVHEDGLAAVFVRTARPAIEAAPS